jgi:hypothetical protein
MDIFIYIAIFVIGFILGWNAREQTAVARVNEMMKQVEAEEEQTPSNLIPIIIEPHNDHYYVYGATDRTFMAQGGSRKELEDNLAKRYPGKMFAATPQNLKEIGFNHDTNSK